MAGPIDGIGTHDQETRQEHRGGQEADKDPQSKKYRIRLHRWCCTWNVEPLIEPCAHDADAALVSKGIRFIEKLLFGAGLA